MGSSGVRLKLPSGCSRHWQTSGSARAVGDRTAEHGVPGGAQVLVKALPELRLHVGQGGIAGKVAQLERVLGQVEELRVRQRRAVPALHRLAVAGVARQPAVVDECALNAESVTSSSVIPLFHSLLDSQPPVSMRNIPMLLMEPSISLSSHSSS